MSINNMWSSLDRNLLNPELVWHSGTLDDVQAHSRKEIDHRIDRWKTALEQHTNHGPGCRIVLNFQIKNLDWLAIMLANWELGGQQTSVHPTFPDVWAPWNVVVSDHVAPNHLTARAKYCLSINIDQYMDNNVVTQPSRAKPVSQAVATNTSGSTGTPTPIEHSHECLHALTQRNIKILKFNQFEHGSALLVHGGAHNVLNTHVLPMIAYFEHVHSLPFVPERMQELCQYVYDHKINVIALPHALAVDLFLKHAPKFNHSVTLQHFQANQVGWLKLVKEKNIHSVHTSYGATEVLGPVLANEITQESNSLYSPFNFGKPEDDFYNVRLTEQNNLEVVNQYRGVHVLGDYFTQDSQDNLIYHNRNKTIRLRNQDIPWDVLEKCVRTHGNPSYMCIVGDDKTECVYMLFDQSYSQHQIDAIVKNINVDLAQVNTSLSIDYIDCVSIVGFINSHKVNLLQVRDHFRKKFNLLKESTYEENN